MASKPSLDAHFHAAGMKALLAHPEVQLIARANNADHFCVWAARFVDTAVVDAVSVWNGKHTTWLNNYVRQEKKFGLLHNMPFVRSVCVEAHRLSQTETVSA